jgi:hypothetical protein
MTSYAQLFFESYLRWIVGQIQEETNVFHRTVFFEILLEETRSFHVHTHSGKNNSEIVIALLVLTLGQLDKTALSHNLSGNLKLAA